MLLFLGFSFLSSIPIFGFYDFLLVSTAAEGGTAHSLLTTYVYLAPRQNAPSVSVRATRHVCAPASPDPGVSFDSLYRPGEELPCWKEPAVKKHEPIVRPRSCFRIAAFQVLSRIKFAYVE